MSINRTAIVIVLVAATLAATARVTDYVDPRIGSEGLGRVFIGPSHPYGMVKPSPDCTPSPNSGWLPMPERVDGFSQVHVSGTGGGAKYGNISIMPFVNGMNSTTHISSRLDEEISLGYYATTLADGIKTEITAAPRAAVYRFTFPNREMQKGFAIDAGFFLGEERIPDAREAQQLVGSQIHIVNDREVQGYSRVRGGWNNGRAYTVYFCAMSNVPLVKSLTWRDNNISTSSSQPDHGDKTGALLQLPSDTHSCEVTIGISFISELKARENCLDAITGKTFDDILSDNLNAWESLLDRITLHPDTPSQLKRMFYTALYHTMLMPTDRSGECPLWNDPTPYYDDYYAIWDTYRTSMPLITLLDPGRQRDIVNSLLTIYRRDGYMPDARSGNANGRTQGGSNADIVIADAMAKGLDSIDYRLALQAMLKNAEVDPGHDHEAHGRGGAREYNTLGYIPHGIDRAGNRTVEYSFCDWTISQVARRLGEDSIASIYANRSSNWKNLWRSDYTHDGARGFIMPRDARGNWIDSIPYGHSSGRNDSFKYTPVTFEGPWYTPWWSMFFYEASSWEYSLSIPHDIPGLIEACGGDSAMLSRLDTFFTRPYFNVNNEPSFLSPCIYHWLGRPDMSGERIRDIIAGNYNDTPMGLPGNDDSGAMSSWLAFHIMGLYPNAGHDYYLVNPPLVKQSVITLKDGKKFTIEARGLSDKNRYITSATLNGNDYPYSTIKHSDIISGGHLVLKMSSKPGQWGLKMFPEP